MWDSILQLLGIVLIFGMILYLAYIATRIVGKKTAKSMQSKHMQVIEQISLGLDKRLILVRVGSEYFLFLSGKKEFRQVAKVKMDGQEEPIQESEQKDSAISGESVFGFRQIFEKYIHSNDRRNQMKNTRSDAEPNPQKSDQLKLNIQRMKQLREKSYDKEV